MLESSSDTSVGTAPPDEGAIDLHDGRLWLLGGAVPATSDISWLPERAAGWESLNCYLLLEPQRALLVDTGVAVNGEAVVSQLDVVLGPDVPLGIYLTRGEADCIGNLGRIADRFNLTCIYAAGRSNPFDYFEDVTRGADLVSEPRFPLERRQGGETIDLDEARSLEVIRPLLRLLATSWGYDPVSKTLFTSDVFSHSRSLDPAAARIPARDDDGTTAVDVARHVVAKFDWLEAVEDPSILASDVDAIFEGREIERIAPTHGRVIEGADTVRRHREWMVAALLGDEKR